MRALALLLALAGPAAAQADPGAKLPPDAATTPAPSSSVGTTDRVPSTAYPAAPVSTPAAGRTDGAPPRPEPDRTPPR